MPPARNNTDHITELATNLNITLHHEPVLGGTRNETSLRPVLSISTRTNKSDGNAISPTLRLEIVHDEEDENNQGGANEIDNTTAGVDLQNEIGSDTFVGDNFQDGGASSSDFGNQSSNQPDSNFKITNSISRIGSPDSATTNIEDNVSKESEDDIDIFEIQERIEEERQVTQEFRRQSLPQESEIVKEVPVLVLSKQESSNQVLNGQHFASSTTLKCAPLISATIEHFEH